LYLDKLLYITIAAREELGDKPKKLYWKGGNLIQKENSKGEFKRRVQKESSMGGFGG
jgi:hypothetical protein